MVGKLCVTEGLIIFRLATVSVTNGGLSEAKLPSTRHAAPDS